MIVYLFIRITEIADNKLRNRILYFSLAIFIIPVILALIWQPMMTMTPDYGPRFFDSFFSGSGLYFIILTLFTLIGILYFGFIRRNTTYLLIFLILVFQLYFFSYHWERYFRPRYASYILPFFLITTSAGFYGLYQGILSIGKNKLIHNIYVILALLIVLTVFNIPLDAVEAANYNKHKYVKWTNEYHDPVSNLVIQYKDAIDDEDILVSSLTNALRWHFDIPLDRKIYNHGYKNPDRYSVTEHIINSHNSGWIFLDERRGGTWGGGYSRNDFFINDTYITYYGRTDGWFVYSWGKNTSSI